QWMWKFSYPDGKVALDVLTVPAHRPVKLIMTSGDVIHSFFVPQFRVKQDVVPGRYVTAWFEATAPGRYDIYCAEFCGTSHSRMLGAVLVLPPDQYDEWLESAPKLITTEAPEKRPPSASDLAARGRDIAVRYACLACHTVDGQRHLGPSWAGLYGR